MDTFTPIYSKILTLSNGDSVDIELLEKETKRICHYVQYVAFALKDEKKLVAMIFPSRKLLSNPDYEKTPEEGCFCPRNLNELGKCLSGCMHTLNLTLLPGYAKINSAVIINDQLSVEDETLTPTLCIVPDKITKKYKDHLYNLFGHKIIVKEEAFNMKFN
jgi:long-subunit acyl-CoA synthetase (AMP-forming)